MLIEWCFSQSWVATCAALEGRLGVSARLARLGEQLLADRDLHGLEVGGCRPRRRRRRLLQRRERRVANCCVDLVDLLGVLRGRLYVVLAGELLAQQALATGWPRRTGAEGASGPAGARLL